MSVGSLKVSNLSEVASIATIVSCFLAVFTSVATTIYVFAVLRVQVDELRAQQTPSSIAQINEKISDVKVQVADIHAKVDMLIKEGRQR